VKEADDFELMAVQKKLAEETWGSAEAVDGTGDYTPRNIHKARRARWALVRKELHDSPGLCNWMGPWVALPFKERGYSGDDSPESECFSMATGRPTNRDELDQVGERIFVLHRALTIRDMGDKDMRAKHGNGPLGVTIYDNAYVGKFFHNQARQQIRRQGPLLRFRLDQSRRKV
jgi:aldehyde:ferredoxin oxidoreductase